MVSEWEQRGGEFLKSGRKAAIFSSLEDIVELSLLCEVSSPFLGVSGRWSLKLLLFFSPCLLNRSNNH